MFEMIFDRVTPNEKEAEQQNQCQERQGQRNPFANGKPPQLIVQPVSASISFLRHCLISLRRRDRRRAYNKTTYRR
jgi:hypothetical protein